MLVALFAVQNSHEVMVKFLAWELQTSLALLVIGAVAAGALLLGLLALFRQVGLGLKLWDERSRARKTVSDLDQARLAGQQFRKEIARLQEHTRRLAARLAESHGPAVTGARDAPRGPAVQPAAAAGQAPAAAGHQASPVPAGPEAPATERPPAVRG